jgi:hypothetical protein
LPPLPALNSPARPPPSKVPAERLVDDPEAVIDISDIPVDDPEIVRQKAIAPKPVKKVSTPPLQTLTIDKRQLELNKKLMESKQKQPQKKWWKLDIDLNPAQLFTSLNPSAKAKPNTNGNSNANKHPANINNPPSNPTTVSNSTSLPANAAKSNSTAASVCPPPSPVTILITNFAVYVLSPAVFKDGRYSLDFTNYKRYPLLEILLVSLPYRSGISYSGGDYALRINDFSLHLTDDRDVWLLSPRGKRSMVVEVISDAFLHLTNRQLDMQQPDYTELIASILDRSIYAMIRELRDEEASS